MFYDAVETYLDISRESQEVVARQLNDELNSFSPLQGATNLTAGAAISSSMTTIINNQEICYSVEEIIRRVEDISRMH